MADSRVRPHGSDGRFVARPMCRNGHARVPGQPKCLICRRERERDSKSTIERVRTPTRQSWRAMRERCHRPSHSEYRYYGGRGITVCSRWDVFENFLADMGERPPGHTLDRIDPDGSYEPGNCRWATPKQQRANRSKR